MALSVSSHGTRLDSWKEISQYLGRYERTVQRWEVERGLPIHRLPGVKRGGVFAYTAELDDWLAQTSGLEEDESDEHDSSVKHGAATAGMGPEHCGKEADAPSAKTQAKEAKK